MKILVSQIKEVVVLMSVTNEGIYYYVTKDAVPQQVIDYMAEEVKPMDFANIYNECYMSTGEAPMVGVAVDKDLFVFADGSTMTPKELDMHLFPTMYEQKEISDFVKNSAEIVAEGINAIKRKHSKKKQKKANKKG